MSLALGFLLAQPSAQSNILEVEAPSTSASAACLCKPRPFPGAYTCLSAQRRRRPQRSLQAQNRFPSGALANARAPFRRQGHSVESLLQLNSLRVERVGQNEAKQQRVVADGASKFQSDRSRPRVEAAAGPSRPNASSVHSASSYAFKGTSAWGPPGMSAQGQENTKGVGGLPDNVSSLQSEFWRQQQLASLEKATMGQETRDNRVSAGGWEGEVINGAHVQVMRSEQEPEVLSSADLMTPAAETSGAPDQAPEQGLVSEGQAGGAEVGSFGLLGVNGFHVNGVAKALEGLLGKSDSEGPEAQDVHFKDVLEESSGVNEGARGGQDILAETVNEIPQQVVNSEEELQQDMAAEALFLAEGSAEGDDGDIFEDALGDEANLVHAEDEAYWEEAGLEPEALLSDIEEDEEDVGESAGEVNSRGGDWERDRLSDGEDVCVEELELSLQIAASEDWSTHSLCHEPFPIGLVDSIDCGSDTTIFEFGPSLDEDLSEFEEGLQEVIQEAKRRKAQEDWEEKESTDFVFVNGIPELDDVDLDDSALEPLSSPEEGILSSKEEAGAVEGPQKQLQLKVGVSSLPHPLKASRGGEDAYLVEGNWLGVADGISTWAEQGINSGLYSRELLWNCVDVVRTSWELLGVCPKPTAVIEESHSRTDLRGSCTITLAVVEGQTLRVANIGDSGFILLRVGDSVMQSERMAHGLNDPFQIGCNFGDDPSCAKAYESELQHGDVLLLATDGLFDNMYKEQIVRELRLASLEAKDPELVAKRLATLAQKVGESETGDTPYADWSRSQGQPHEGGKREDVTVIVAYVQDPDVM